MNRQMRENDTVDKTMAEVSQQITPLVGQRVSDEGYPEESAFDGGSIGSDLDADTGD